MSYMTKHRSGLGGITDVLTAANDVVTDPCLFEAAKLVSAYHDLAPPSTTPSTGPGIGLCSAVPVLKAAVYIRSNPWVVPVGIIAVVGSLVGIGYLIGEGGRRSTVRTAGQAVNPSRRRRR